MRQMLKGLAVALMIFAAETVWSGTAFAADHANAGAQAKDQAAESVLSHIERAASVADGKSPHVAYIFFDPNCPYCHRLFEDTRSWVKHGKIELRWIPVGILTTTSEGKAAAILDAKDPLQAFYRNEENYSRSGGLGGIDEALPTAVAEQKLKLDATLLARTGFDGVPVTIFRADNGAAVMFQGAPPKDKLHEILRHVK